MNSARAAELRDEIKEHKREIRRRRAAMARAAAELAGLKVVFVGEGRGTHGQEEAAEVVPAVPART